MANLVDSYIEQTTMKVEVQKYDDGTTRHRLIQAFTRIVGEEQFKKKAPKKVLDVAIQDTIEDFM